MKLLGRDADLGSEAELLAVGERRRRVHHDGGGVDTLGEPLRNSEIGRDDGRSHIR